MDKLNTKYWFSTMKDTSGEQFKEHIETLLRKVSMPVKAVLGESTITVNDFANLQICDIIKLNSKVNNDLNIYVGNIRKFKALPGSTKDSYAVRVTSILREGE